MRAAVVRLVVGLNRRLRTMGLGDAPLIGRVRRFAQGVIARGAAHDGRFIIDVRRCHMLVPEGRYLWAYARYEPASSRLFTELLRPGSVVVDAGACFGYYSLLAAQAIGETGTVYAFEPLPQNFAILTQNIALNDLTGRVIPHQKAVSNAGGSVSLHLARFVENTSLTSSPSAEVSALPVEALALDDFLAGRPVDVIKLDLEGHELHAIAGLERTIRAAPRLVVFCEINIEYLGRAGSPPERLLARLAELGFEVRLVDEEKAKLLPVTPQRLEDIARDPVRFSNLLCVKGMRM